MTQITVLLNKIFLEKKTQTFNHTKIFVMTPMKHYKNTQVTIQSYIKCYEYKQTYVSAQNELIYHGEDIYKSTYGQ